MMLVAEGMHLRTGDPVRRALARRWSKVFGVLFAVRAVSGTIISFEPGLLWPRFMAYAGGIIGLPFSLEGAAFFLEAIFVGIYLYGWDRLSPRLHWLSGIPIAFSAAGSAFFIVTANAWMNSREASGSSTAESPTSIRWPRCSTRRGRPRPRPWCSARIWPPRSAWPACTPWGCSEDGETRTTERGSRSA